MAAMIKPMSMVLVAAMIIKAVAPQGEAAIGCGTVVSYLKSLAGSYFGVNYRKAAGLPGQCGANIPYKISPSTDCSKVQ